MKFFRLEIEHPRFRGSDGSALGPPSDLPFAKPYGSSFELVPFRFAREISEVVAVRTLGFERDLIALHGAFEFQLVQPPRYFVALNLQIDSRKVGFAQRFRRKFPVTGKIGGERGRAGEQSSSDAY